jgi:uracil-DNA glycosylase
MQGNLFETPAPQPTVNIQIEPSWKKALMPEFQKDYFQQVREKLKEEKKQGHTIYPPGPLIFNAFNQTPFDRVRVVILGQDPYHGPGQAHGLCFSVQDGVKPPPSLVNIYKEINSDLGIPIPNTGNLEPWARQGVFLLNAILTVRARQPASHKHLGWEQFTDAVIQTLSEKREHLVFLLWGKFAQGKRELIDPVKHLILTAPHPSPYSASYGFFGCRHFSQTNNYLKKHGEEPIDWSL